MNIKRSYTTQKRSGISFKITLLLLTLIPLTAQAENIDMFVGEVKVLGKHDVDRVAVGNGKKIRVDVLKNGELLIIAQLKGSSSLHLWNKDGTRASYNIRISENDPEKRVRMEDMVLMKVQIVEFRKSKLGKLGIDWAKDINGPTFATIGDFTSSTLFRPAADSLIGASKLPLAVNPFSSYFGIATAITSRINYLASTGDAVTLAEPTLSCINGGSAKFIAGGEIPYPVTSALGQTNVEFKEYGIKLEISPTANEKGQIYASISTEVSQIDPGVSVNGIPGLITRKTETQMNLHAGQTIVISGLLDSQSGQDIDRVAGLGEIPIIGSLFSSKNYRNQLSELVIFVTPQIIKPDMETSVISDKDAMLLERRNQVLKDVGKKLDYSIMD